ncbi:type II toxin-antitoxin system HicA family toxin [Stratiformator vulcanicus]|uniref:type II toxin-antitoxin system HicA family toxin n=1 Tax=Stratiformator vulcanicus TaxID=2527980 RepID=UPI0011A06B85
MKRHKLIKHLAAQKCRFVREGGRHLLWVDASGERKSAIPRHSEIPKKLVKSICRQLGVSEPPSAA